MTHVMLDLETFGTKPGSVLRSIGAVVFGFDGSTSAEFYRNIDKQSCLDAGLTVAPLTEAWWGKQSAESQAALLIDPQPLHHVVVDFYDWWSAIGGDKVWSQGANFDPALWEAASATVKIGTPWKFYNVRDTRTVYDVCFFDVYSLKRDGTYHNALDDAKHQVRCVAAALAKQKVAA